MKILSLACEFSDRGLTREVRTLYENQFCLLRLLLSLFRVIFSNIRFILFELLR